MMLKVIAVCGSCMVSSEIIKMKIEKIFNEKGLEAEITHMNTGEAKAQAKDSDIIICSQALVEYFDKAREAGAIVVGVKNLLSEQEIREKIESEVIGEIETKI